MNRLRDFSEKLPPLPLVTDNIQIPMMEQIRIETSGDGTERIVPLIVPEAFRDKRILLRMDSVGSTATVLADG